MKKKKWFKVIGIVVGILLFFAVAVVALGAILSLKGYGISTGRFYTNNFGIYLVDEGEAMLMSDKSKNQNVFENFSIGDLLLVVHSGVNETYPAQTGAYYVFRLKKGNESDLPENLDVGVRPLPDDYGQNSDGNETGVSKDKVSDADILKQMEKIDFDVQYIRTDGFPEYMEYPAVKIIRSVDELNTYYEENKEKYNLERRENPASDYTIGFLDACDKYDAEYFENQILVMVLLEEPSGSYRHKVEQVGIYGEDEKNMVIDISSLIPEVGTCDMALWHILIEPEAGITVANEDEVKVFRDGKNVTVADQPTVVSHGNEYANITLDIPKGWEYEIYAQENDQDSLRDFGIAFWPKDAPEGKINVWYYQWFGVCGTGLKEKEISIGNYKAYQGTYDGKPVWDYIYFKDTPPGAYVARTEWSQETVTQNSYTIETMWWDTYGAEVMEILATAKLGEDILTEEKVIETAKYKCNIEYDQIKAEFSYEKATWTVSFFEGYNENGDTIVGGDLQVVMDVSGNIMDLIYGE